MAGLDAAAGIVGLTGFAYHLTRSLYEAGSAFAAARKETKRIARNVNNYANVLDMLNDLIEKDESLTSSKAYNLVGDIIEQSYDLFDEIERRLPGSRANREDLKVGEKLKWMFRRSKVEPLVREIESLKTNVAALQGVLCFGGILKAAKERANDQQTRPSELNAQKLAAQRLRAENSIVDHLEARSDFIRGVEATEARSQSSQGSDESSETGLDEGKMLAVVRVRQHTSLQISVQRNDPFSRFSESLEEVHDASQRETILLSNTSSVLQDLVNEWTTLDASTGAGESVHTQPAKTAEKTHNAVLEDEKATRPDFIEVGPSMLEELMERHSIPYSSTTSKHSEPSRLGNESPMTSIEKLREIANVFDTDWRPACEQSIRWHASDLASEKKQYQNLSEVIMTQIVLKADEVDVSENEGARCLRKDMISEAKKAMKELDRLANIVDGQMRSLPTKSVFNDDELDSDALPTLDELTDPEPDSDSQFSGWTSEAATVYTPNARSSQRRSAADWYRERSKESGMDNNERPLSSKPRTKEHMRIASSNSKQSSQRETSRDDRKHRTRKPVRELTLDKDGIRRKN